jgi:AAA domain
MHDIGALIEPVARELWGPPNIRLSNARELRWGERGGRMIRLDGGTWADHSHEHSSINSGGVLDLIARETGLDHKAAFVWLKQHGRVDEEPQPDKRGLGQQVASYDYIDEAGELLFQVVRFEPKTFRQRKKDADGEWSWSVRGTRQVPYRLPELVEAIAMGNPVFITEGEKDVENLRALGIPATCNAGGVGKWRAELCPFFAGADVIVLQDNDPQAKDENGAPRFHQDGRPVLPGQDHAQNVAKQLSAVAARVRLVDLARSWPQMPAKADISDWLANGGTADQLYSIVESTPDWTAAPFVSKFGALPWEQIGIIGSPSYSWAIEDVLPLGEITLAFGDSGSGKSFAMLDMSLCITRGIKYNGHNVEPGLVIYVAAEAGKGFSKRKVAYAMKHKLEPSEPLPFVLMTKRPDFFHDDADAVALIEEVEKIRSRYRLRLILIVLDTLSALAPGMNENASADVSMVRKRLMMLQERFDAAIVLVHHMPKNGSQTPRGHGSLTADFETTIKFEISCDKQTNTGEILHRATVEKQREGKKKIFWEFTLPIVEVGRNKWGNPETSCVVEPYVFGSARPGPIGFHATPNEMLFIRALYDALASHPLPPPAGLPKSITKVTDFKNVRTMMRERVIPPHEDNDVADGRFRTAFSRAGAKLRDGAVIGVQGALVWPTGKPVNGFSAPVVD